MNDQINIETHNGYLTIHNPETDGHRTFKIQTQSKDSAFFPGQRIVSLLTGPDRDSFHNWKSIGRVVGNQISLWKKLRGEKLFETYAKMVSSPEKYPSLDYMLEGRCRICNRELTNPESIESGIGPVCRKNHGS